MPTRWIPVLLVAAAAAGGCGSDPQLSRSAAERLHAGVDAVRAAVRDGDRERAVRALDRLEARVKRAEADGELAGADAAALRRGIARARRRAERELAAPDPTVTAEPTVAPTEAPAPEEDDVEEAPEPEGPAGKGKGKAKGHEKPGKDKD